MVEREPRDDAAVTSGVGRAERALASAQQSLAEVDSVHLGADEWQDVSAQLGELMAEFRRAMSDVNRALGLVSGRDRVRRFMVRHVGEPVSSAQLSGVAGIYEWARRVRELRVEEGWPIESGVFRADLDAQVYILTASEPDAELAARWRLASVCRRARTSAKARGLTYLKELHPLPASQDQLFYVMNIASWQRRLRELDEEGWEIRSNIDEPELRPGSYRLASLDMRPPRQRKAIKLRWEILERDVFRCQDCGASRGDPDVRLQVHHLREVSRGGSNDPVNLITLCSNCHAGRHAVAPGTTSDELLVPAAAG